MDVDKRLGYYLNTLCENDMIGSDMEKRTHIKNTVESVGSIVTVMGWVDSRRDHGSLIFLDIRDSTGIVQAVVSPKSEDAYSHAKHIREEWVLKITGAVKKRPDAMVNDDIATGTVEMQVTTLEVLGVSKTPPFPLHTDGLDIDEESRLRYRFIDLRRQRMQNNIRLRSEFIHRVRSLLFDNDFVEIETPLLTQSTPEGARDFVVPSRLQPGSFYALPQSPQQYKQLLMVAGFERYFQIARCLRDEDLRADRAFEHSQIDMEMSFMDEEAIRAFDEDLITRVYEAMGATIKEKPFPVFSYQEAMEQFGADKFDLRTEEEKREGILAFAWVVDFPFFEKKDDGKWTFTHNPFSMPKHEHIDFVLEEKRLDEVVAHQYDLVCNGYEIGSGSIRSHHPNITRSVFSILGYTEEHIEEQFGHMLEAFSFGAPPHGGIAHGIERLMMLITNEQYLREVQAFPQTSSGRTAVMNAPAPLSHDQLDELKVNVNTEDEKER